MTMPRILIRNLNNQLIDSKDNSKSVLNIIHDAGIDWMFACGGKGKCTTCKLIVIDGIEQISDLSEQEQKFRDIGKLKENERLACQSRVSGDITAEVANENKFPHVDYSY